MADRREDDVNEEERSKKISARRDEKESNEDLEMVEDRKKEYRDDNEEAAV